jgi:ORF6N domain
MGDKKETQVEVISDAALMLPRIESRILTLRNQRIIVDADLASLYGVDTKRLNEQVKRNSERFPQDFMFQLNAAEKAEVVANCDHLNKLKFSKVLPFAFTEYGAIQAANVLNSTRAVEMGIFVVRAFVRLKQATAANAELTKRLDELEQSTERLAISHDTFSRNTRIQLKQLFDALRELANTSPPQTPKRPIGFIIQEDKSSDV